MPPKKKKGKRKKKKKTEKGELTVDDKYKKTLDEIQALKDHLATRKELSRKAQSQSVEWKTKMKDAEETLEERQEDHKAVSADMTRQYKTMQTEMGLRIHQLETELARTRTQLERTESDLRQVTEDKERMERTKNQEIDDLRMKIEAMGLQYEHVLNDALDKLIEKIDVAKIKWEDKSTVIQAHNKHTLLEFGLNPLDL